MNAYEKISQRKAVLRLKIEHCETKISHSLQLLKLNFSPTNLAAQIGTEVGAFLSGNAPPHFSSPSAVELEKKE